MENNTNSLHVRFSSAPWYDPVPLTVMVGGAGGIGSWVSLLLARAGFKPYVLDFDLLEEHNLGGQCYSRKDIGKRKIDALTGVIKDFCDLNILASNIRVDKTTFSNEYVIAAFDNMQARVDMFSNWKKVFGNEPQAIFIDGRLEAEQFWIYCVRGADAKAIEEYSSLVQLDTDKMLNEPELPCTMKQTSHAAAMIASHMVGFFTNHITNVRDKDNSRVVPFEWSYFIPLHMSE